MGSVRAFSHASAAPLTSGDRRARTVAWYWLSQSISSARSKALSMQRVSIGHSVKVSNVRNSPNGSLLGAAIMVAGAQAGRERLARTAGVDALIVDADNSLWLSPGMARRLQRVAV